MQLMQLMQSMQSMQSMRPKTQKTTNITSFHLIEVATISKQPITTVFGEGSSFAWADRNAVRELGN